MGFKFPANSPELGIATSSGQFGHAFSLGEGDVVTIFGTSAGLADAAATRICNEVVGDDFEKAILNALEVIDDLEGIHGAFIARGDFIGKKGEIPPLIRISDDESEEQNIFEKKFTIS